MDRHLVAIKVGIKGGTYQRVKLDGLSLDKDGFKGLYPQSVQSRRPVQKDTVFFDNLIKGIKDSGVFSLHHLLCTLDRRDEALYIQLVVNERLEEFQGHLF